MPPVSKPSPGRYDFIVIGGGSGGMGASVSKFRECTLPIQHIRRRDVRLRMAKRLP